MAARHGQEFGVAHGNLVYFRMLGSLPAHWESDWVPCTTITVDRVFCYIQLQTPVCPTCVTETGIPRRSHGQRNRGHEASE